MIWGVEGVLLLIGPVNHIASPYHHETRITKVGGVESLIGSVECDYASRATSCAGNNLMLTIDFHVIC